MTALKSLKSYYRASVPLDFAPGAWFVYRSSNNMTPQSVGSPICGTSNFDCDVTSQDVVVVGDSSKSDYLLVGALTANRSMTYLNVRRRNARMQEVIVEQPMIKRGDKPEELMIQRGSDWRQLLKEYGEASAAAMGVKPIQPESNLVGYCTWYYYYADVSEKNFLENVKALASKKKSPYSKGVAQIDDGYQTFQGDWLDQHESWPTPLEKIAQDTAAKGLIPGIWTMPMCASTASRVYNEHKDWFVKDSRGKVLEFQGWSPAPNNMWCCLDATNPAVREHLTSVFQTLWKWGYRYFKMDGLGFGLPEGRRFDPTATAVSAFRLALKTIREAVPEAHLLGCCPPFMACLGYCDSCRVSPDTARWWTKAVNPNCDEHPGSCNIKAAYHSTIANWWMFDRWFRCDPDTLMARQDNAWYTLGEARISVLTGILTGVAITSDNLGTIAPERLALLDFAAKTRMKDVQPLDGHPFHWPQMWEGTIDGKRAVAFVNDGECAQKFKLEDAGMKAGKEVLQKLGVVKDTITLAPHDAALVIAK